MSFIIDNIPYFHCLVRREYTRNLRDRHGEYLAAVAFAAWCKRGRMIGFQVVFTGEDERGNDVPTGGAMYSQVPIEALCWKPCDKPADYSDIAPWDVFSETFTAVTFNILSGVRSYVLPKRLPGRYMFTLDFAGSDLADDPQQHKQLHVIKLDDGWFSAVPNNRLLVEDRAFWNVTDKRPDFEALSHVFCAE